MSNTLDLLSTAEYAGGTFLRRVNHWAKCVFGSSIDGTSGATLELPADHDALADITLNTVFKITFNSTVYEYRVFDISDRADAPTTTITATPLLHDLGFVFLRDVIGGIPTYDLAGSLLTPTEWMDNWIIPNFLDQGITWFATGTVTPTSRRSMEWSMENVLAFLLRLVDKDAVEVSLRRDSGASKYDIDLVALGASAQQSVTWVGRNVTALDRTITRDGMATSIRPSAPAQSGAVERDTPAYVEWDVVDMVDPGGGRMSYTLRNPDGTTAIPPFDRDDEVNGLLVRSHIDDWIMSDSYYSGMYASGGHTFPTGILNAVIPAWYKSPYETGAYQYRGLLVWPNQVAAGGENDTLKIWRMPRVLGPGTPQTNLAASVDWQGTFIGGPFIDYGASEAAGRVYGYVGSVTGVYYHVDVHPSAGSSSVTVNRHTTAIPTNGQGGCGVYRPTGTKLYIGTTTTDCKIHKQDVSALGNAWTSYTLSGTTWTARGMYYHAAKDRIYIWCSDRKLRIWNPSTDTEVGTGTDLSSYFYASGLLAGLDMVIQSPSANCLAIIGYGPNYATNGSFKIITVDISSTDSPAYSAASAEWIPTPTATHAGAFYYSPSLDRLLYSWHLATGGTYQGVVTSWTVAYTGGVYAVTLAETHYLRYSGTAAVRYPQKFMEVEGVTFGFSKDGEAWALAAPDGNYLKRTVYDSVGATAVVTTETPFPSGYVNNYNTEDTMFNGRVRFNGPNGEILTELDDPTAIAAYGRIVREIRSEDYWDDPRTGAINLLENGALSRWNDVVTNNPLYQYSPLGFSVPDNAYEWHPKLDPSGFPAEATASYSVLLTYAGTYAASIDVKLASGGPLTLRPGDLLYYATTSTQAMVAETIEINSSTYTSVAILRPPTSGAYTGVTGTAYTFSRTALKTWAAGRKLLPVGIAGILGTVSGSTFLTHPYGAARVEFQIGIPSPLPPGTKLFIGCDFGLWVHTNATPADPYVVMRCYDYPSQVSTNGNTFDVSASLASLGWPGTLVAGNFYSGIAEASWTIAGGRRTWRCMFQSLSGIMFIKSVWAYIAYESKASLMAVGYGAGAGSYELYHLAQMIRRERAMPQISYTVQALEDDAAAPFVEGGMTRLVDTSRGIDTVSRILGWERELVPEGSGAQYPALRIENREGELTRTLLNSGVV